MVRVGLVVVAMAAVSACGPTFDQHVLPDDVKGEAWPLTIPSFRVNCTNGLDVFIVDDAGIGYQIRGGGRSGSAAFGGEVRDLALVRKKDPTLQASSPGALLAFEATRREALSRCIEAGLARFNSEDGG